MLKHQMPLNLFFCLSLLFIASSVHAAAPSLISSLNTSGYADAVDIQVSGKYAYIATKQNTPDFYIIDISTPTPFVAGSFSEPSKINKIYIQGDRAYLATDSDRSELVILDIRNRNAPVKIGSYNLPGTAMASSIYAVGHQTVFVGKKKGTTEEFYLLNTLDPLNIVQLGSYEVDYHVNDIVVNRDLAFLGTSNPNKEIIVLNISNPAQLTQVGSFDLPGTNEVFSLDMSVGKLYALSQGTSANDLNEFNVSATGVLTLSKSFHGNNIGTDVYVYANKAFITSSLGFWGLNIFDLNGSSTQIPISFNTIDKAEAVVVDESTVYAVTDDNNKELQIINPGQDYDPVITDINNDNMKVVSALGDSNTWIPEDVVDYTFWPEFLQGFLDAYQPGWTVINRAFPFTGTQPIGGYPNAFAQLQSTLTNDSPDAVIMAWGGGDITLLINLFNGLGGTGVPPYPNFDFSLNNFKSLLTIANSSGVKSYVTHLAITATNDPVRDQCEFIFNNRLKNELPREILIPFNTGIVAPDDFELPDHLHIVESGQLKRAQMVFKKIK